MSRSTPPSMFRSLSRGILLPVVAGSVALVLAAVLGWVTIRDMTSAEPAAAQPKGAEKLPTDRLVSEVGGFSFAVPRDLEAARQGGTVRLASAAKDLVIVVGRGERGSLVQAEKRFLSRLSREYPKVSLLGSQSATVNGNATETVYGRAVNDAGTRLRFAVVTIHSGRQNFEVASYTAYDADPATVLPRVNTVVNSFEVLPLAK